MTYMYLNQAVFTEYTHVIYYLHYLLSIPHFSPMISAFFAFLPTQHEGEHKLNHLFQEVGIHVTLKAEAVNLLDSIAVMTLAITSTLPQYNPSLHHHVPESSSKETSVIPMLMERVTLSVCNVERTWTARDVLCNDWWSYLHTISYLSHLTTQKQKQHPAEDPACGPLLARVATLALRHYAYNIHQTKSGETASNPFIVQTQSKLIARFARSQNMTCWISVLRFFSKSKCLFLRQLLHQTTSNKQHKQCQFQAKWDCCSNVENL